MTVILLVLAGCKGEPQAACTDCEAIGLSPRFARLTHLQWENATADLFGLPAPTGLSEAFIGDTLSAGGFDNDANVLQVTPELWSDYQRAAEGLLQQVIVDEALYAAVAPEDPTLGLVVADSVRIEAESDEATATTGGSLGDAWMVWANGELAATFDVPAGSYTVASAVWGDQAGPDPVLASLRIDGSDVLTQDVLAVSGSAPDLLEFSAELTGPTTVSVAFLNDFVDGAEDRNLIVDWIELRPEVDAPTNLPEARDQWIRRFGQRVHRRPLTEAQVERYAALFDLGSALEVTGSPFRDGVYTTLLAMLQSPFYLYRVELSTSSDEGGRIPLDGYEIASKLSFALVNSAPDQSLLSAAEAGELDSAEGVRAAAEQLLSTERGSQAIDHFHHQLLNLDSYGNIYKDPAAFPEWSPELNALMAEEARLYTRHSVLDGAGIFGFYTDPTTWVTGDLAWIYGVSAGADFERVELDPSQRAGILTTSGFLAANAHASDIDSIHRGVFVNLRLLCSDLPPPPAEIPPLPPLEPGLSNRERVDTHTGPGTCGGNCHGALINPVGFAFENYDAVGRWRDTDAGNPVDASGSFDFLDAPRRWSDPVGFAAAMGSSLDAHHCLIRNWMRYTHGREPTEQDETVVRQLTSASVLDDLPLRDLVVELVSAESFRFRSPELE